MNFHFEQLNNTSGIEKLEDGVYIEKIYVHNEVSEAVEDEEYRYGSYQEGIKGWVYEPDPGKNLMALGVILMNQFSTGDAADENAAIDLESFYDFDETDGCTLSGFIEFMSEQGFSMEQYTDLSMKETMELLESDGKLLCAVHSGMMEGYQVSRLKGIMADCLIEVISLDISNPTDIRIYYNMPTDRDGCGKDCQWDVFQGAWKTSNRYGLYIRKG